MDEEVFNLEIRKFLKTFGVTAQREIEKAVRDAIDEGRLKGDETVNARAVLRVDGMAEDVVVESDLRLE